MARILNKDGTLVLANGDLPMLKTLNDEAHQAGDDQAPYALHPEDVADAALDQARREMAPLTRVQFNAILAILGVTIDQVYEAIDTAITDPVANAVAKARVRHSEQYWRSNDLFSLLGPLLGFTDAEVDAAWPEALAI